jgi:ankyrin repeat protein
MFGMAQPVSLGFVHHWNTKNTLAPVGLGMVVGEISYTNENLSGLYSNLDNLFCLQKGFTPLHIACKYGNIKVVRLLLQKEANANVQGKNGLTPLHVATHYNHVNVALLLMNKGASPHCTAKNGYTPLHIAAKKNQMDIATTLLEYGAKPDAESKVNYCCTAIIHISACDFKTCNSLQYQIATEYYVTCVININI